MNSVTINTEKAVCEVNANLATNNIKNKRMSRKEILELKKAQGKCAHCDCTDFEMFGFANWKRKTHYVNDSDNKMLFAIMLFR